MATKEQVTAAERTLDLTIERLQKLASTNAPYGAKVTAEQNYALAYDVLVRMGARRAVRAKYRVR